MRTALSLAALLTSLALCAGARAAVPAEVPEASPLAAISPIEVEPAQNGVQLAQDFMPLEIILAALRMQYGGHQLSVSGPNPDDVGYVYEIKWLTEDGAVLYVTADAESGEVLSLEGE
jgi:hypothetical protein